MDQNFGKEPRARLLMHATARIYTLRACCANNFVVLCVGYTNTTYFICTYVRSLSTLLSQKFAWLAGNAYVTIDRKKLCFLLVSGSSYDISMQQFFFFHAYGWACIYTHLHRKGRHRCTLPPVEKTFSVRGFSPHYCFCLRLKKLLVSVGAINRD